MGISVDEMKVGDEYVLVHKSKGMVRGKFMAFVNAPPGDLADRVYLNFWFDTAPGSGQERLARSTDGRTGQTVATTETNIRPSKVTEIIKSSRSPKLEEPELEAEEATEQESVRGSVFRRLFRR